jgi:DNA-binding CsgD family transcriptional regulator
MGRLVIGIELIVIAVGVGALSAGGTPLLNLWLVPLSFTLGVPLIGSLMAWSARDVAAAYRDAFAVTAGAGRSSLSLRIWVFQERAAYLGGILGLLLAANRAIPSFAAQGFSRAFPAWIAVALFGLSAVLLGVLFRVLRGTIQALSRMPIRELDLAFSPDFCACYAISPREQEVMQCLMRGRRYREIAEELFISIKTVKSHVHSVYVKTSSRGRMDLVRLLQLATKNHTKGR